MIKQLVEMLYVDYVTMMLTGRAVWFDGTAEGKKQALDKLRGR